jgi:CHAD domain-containing protein
MEANTPLVDGLRSDIDQQVRKLKKRLKRARSGDEDGVHDSRTELRRLRTQLDIMGRTVFEPKAAERVGDRLRKAEKTLAKTRDSDVMIADLEKYLEAHPNAREGLGDYRRRLRRRRKRAARKLGKRLAQGLHRDLGDFAQKAAVAPALDEATEISPALVRDFTHEEIWHRYDAVRAYADHLPGDEEVLHEFRSKCRELRFAIELFADALPATHTITRELHTLQDQVGEMHDHHVIAMLITKWKRNEKLSRTKALDDYQRWNRSERDRLRKRFQSSWLSILDPRFRTRLAHALEREAPS